MRSERRPAVGLDPLTAEPNHARDRGLEVVVTDLPDRHPAEDAEGVGVAFEEGFLSRRGTDAVHGLAGVGESEAEQRASDKLAPQLDGHITEVDLCLPAREMFLWDERGCGLSTGLDPDLPASGRDVVPHHPV